MTAIDDMIANHVSKLVDGRSVLTVALETDIAELHAARRYAGAESSRKAGICCRSASPTTSPARRKPQRHRRAGRRASGKARGRPRHPQARAGSRPCALVGKPRRDRRPGHHACRKACRGACPPRSRRWRPILPRWRRAVAGIDGLVAAQVEKLAEGRDILKRALEADLAKVSGKPRRDRRDRRDAYRETRGRPQPARPGARRRPRQARRHRRNAWRTPCRGPRLRWRGPWKPTSRNPSQSRAEIDGLCRHPYREAGRRPQTCWPGQLETDLAKLQRHGCSPRRKARRGPQPAGRATRKRSRQARRHRRDAWRRGWRKAAAYWRAPLEADLAKLSQSRAEIDGIAATHVEKLAEGRDLLARTLEEDLTRIEGITATHIERLSEGRSLAGARARRRSRKTLRKAAPRSTALPPNMSRCSPRAATPWRGRSKRISPGSETSTAAHVERLAEGRGVLNQALEADLAKLAESRAGIDGLVAAQVEKLAEGRDILKRALEADLAKLSESRAEIDGIAAKHVETLAEGRNVLSRSLEQTSHDRGHQRRAYRKTGARPRGAQPVAGSRPRQAGRKPRRT